MNELISFAREVIGPRSEDIEGPQRPLPLEPGCLITWNAFEGPLEARVDGLHQDPDGQQWVDCTLPDGNWVSVDSELVTVLAGPIEP